MAINVGRSPKSIARSRLVEKYKRRANHQSNLWLYYSPKTKSDWALSSDLEFSHAILLEALPEVVRFDLVPQPYVVSTSDGDYKTEFDALVWFKERGPEAREVKYQAEQETPTNPRTLAQREAQILAARQIGAERRVITEVELAPHACLIANWVRIVAFLTATRDYPVGEYERIAAVKLANADGETTLGELCREITPAYYPVFLSAVFSLHQAGLYESDLHQAPLSRSTRIWPRGH
jgi:hypothetical protein